VFGRWAAKLGPARRLNKWPGGADQDYWVGEVGVPILRDVDP
jgi:hypothetical protein